LYGGLKVINRGKVFIRRKTPLRYCEETISRYPPLTCDEPSMKRTKKMPLHRDIYWVGKQWSVTGYGMQAIDQKLKGKFDIEASRIWEDGWPDALSDEKWFNAKDFDKGLSEARKRYPKPPDLKPKPPSKASLKAVPKAVPGLVAPASSSDAAGGKHQPKPSPDPAPANFTMRLEGCRAKFLTTWRVRMR
jgi:hypothetical protein